MTGATRGVTVSMSAFLACHQCYCAGSSLAWGLNLLAVVCGIFWSSSPWVFSGYSGFLPSLHRFNGSANKIKAQINAISTVKLNSWAVPSYQVARNMTLACDKRSMYCTWFAHDCARAIWAYVLEIVCGAVRRLLKISNSAFECDYYNIIYYYKLLWFSPIDFMAREYFQNVGRVQTTCVSHSGQAGNSLHLKTGSVSVRQRASGGHVLTATLVIRGRQVVAPL